MQENGLVACVLYMLLPSDLPKRPFQTLRVLWKSYVLDDAVW